jgi:hypothetical protein
MEALRAELRFAYTQHGMPIPKSLQEEDSEDTDETETLDKTQEPQAPKTQDPQAFEDEGRYIVGPCISPRRVRASKN